MLTFNIFLSLNSLRLCNIKLKDTTAVELKQKGGFGFHLFDREDTIGDCGLEHMGQLSLQENGSLVTIS